MKRQIEPVTGWEFVATDADGRPLDVDVIWTDRNRELPGGVNPFANNGKVRTKGDADLEIISVTELFAQVRDMPPPRWLARPVWPADAYGVLAAEWKAGKTWAELDLVVSVASGTPWMGVYPVERHGPVLVFLGEGGKRKMLRRLEAIAAAKGLRLDDLPIRLCFRVPHLTNEAHLERIERELDRSGAALVVVDPLYLAAKGARGSQLYEMGAALEGIQIACQKADSALMVVTHYNRSEGSGSRRITGAGPAEWGRVLVNITVRSKSVDKATMEETAIVDVAFEGDEIPGTSDRYRRRIRSENPDDLESALHYHVEQIEDDGADDEHSDLSPAQQRVLDILMKATDWLTVRQIGDHVADSGHPLQKRTIQDALARLKADGLAKSYGADGTAHSWRHTGANDAA